MEKMNIIKLRLITLFGTELSSFLICSSNTPRRLVAKVQEIEISFQILDKKWY